MFGEDEEIKQLKKTLSAAGADMEIVKKWIKQLMAVKKQFWGVWGKYLESYAYLKEVLQVMDSLQKELCERKSWDKASIKLLQEYAKELKKIGTSYDNEFVVSREDKEFHLIYDTIRKLLDKFDGADTTRIMLLSEVENLKALAKEKLDREKPDAIALVNFYMTHKDDEIVNLPPEARLEKILELVENEFYRPIYMQIAGEQEYSKKQINAMVQRIVTEK